MKEADVIKEHHNFEIAARISVQKKDNQLWPVTIYSHLPC